MRNSYAKCAEALGCVLAVLIGGCASEPPAPPPAEMEAVANPAEPVVPERAAQEFAQAVAMLEAGRNTDAELELKQLALQYPEFPGPYFNLGLLYERTGKLKEAQQALLELARAAVSRAMARPAAVGTAPRSAPGISVEEAEARKLERLRSTSDTQPTLIELLQGAGAEPEGTEGSR